jgi:uncharacterized protein YecT (DUF1311 family)
MKRTILIASITFSFWVFQNVFASNYDMKGCDDGTIKGGQAAMSICSAEKYDQADAKMNKLYGQLLAKLETKQTKERLRTAQRAWIKYRDANCEFFGDIYGGAPVWRSAEDLNCRVEMTTIRTKELRKYLDN